MENNESFASPKEETPDSKEKPDFEKVIEELWEEVNKQFIQGVNPHAFRLGGSSIWNKFVMQRDKQIAALQEEIRQLKNNESIQCPYCSGSGCDEHESEMTACGYCYGNGRVTTDLMKEHIAQSKTALTDEERKDLPF